MLPTLEQELVLRKLSGLQVSAKKQFNAIRNKMTKKFIRDQNHSYGSHKDHLVQ